MFGTIWMFSDEKHSKLGVFYDDVQKVKNLIHIYPSNSMDMQMDGMRSDDEAATRLYVREDIGTDEICKAYPHWESKVRGLEDLIVDVLTSKRRTITIAGEERELNVVKGRFMKLNRFQLETVMDQR